MSLKHLLGKLDSISNLDEGSMSKSAKNPTGPKFGGYWKGTDKGAPKSGQGVGGCEESILKDLERASVENPRTSAHRLMAEWQEFKTTAPTLYVKSLTSQHDLIEHAKEFSRNLPFDGVPISHLNRHTVVCSSIFARTKMTESKHLKDGDRIVKTLRSLDEFDSLPIRVGAKVAILNLQLQGDSAELWGFVDPKTITKITQDSNDQSIKQFEFNNDPNDVWPRTDNAEYQGHFLMYSAFFGSNQAATNAVSHLYLTAQDIKIINHVTELHEDEIGINNHGHLISEEFKNKQEVIAHFVKQGKTAAAGAAAWERGWRGNTSKTKPAKTPTAPQQKYWWQDTDESEQLDEYGGVGGYGAASQAPQGSTNQTPDPAQKQAKLDQQQIQKNTNQLAGTLNQQGAAQPLNKVKFGDVMTKLDTKPNTNLSSQDLQQMTPMAVATSKALQNPQTANQMKQLIAKADAADKAKDLKVKQAQQQVGTNQPSGQQSQPSAGQTK